MENLLNKKKTGRKIVLFVALVFIPLSFLISQEARQEEYEAIGSDTCVECHETGEHDTRIAEDVSHSIHDGLECLDCHSDKGTMPHKEEAGFAVGFNGCSSCHEDAGTEYTVHGRKPRP